jgi:tetratricopeptide (TPR) repeat protein
MGKYKIFLASSCELEKDREQFEVFINRKNKDWNNKGVFLDLEIWEDFIDSISKTRLQDEYNKAVRECDIFVMLFFTKVGKFTEEEFETAFGQFKATNKPLIYTFFKNADIKSGDLNREDSNSLFDFQEKLKDLGHFYTEYKNIDQLMNKFNHQLDKLVSNGFIKFTQENNKIPHSLTMPPFLPEVFLGREKELKEIEDKLFNENHLLLLVNGNGGIGKTSLASHYFHKYQKKYHHVAWVLSEKSIVDSMLQSLASPLKLQFEKTLPTEERFDILIAALAELEKPCLLIIDNANELPDLEENYRKLRCCSNFHILLTTRITRFSQAEIYKIDALAEEEALQLFKKYYPAFNQEEECLFKEIREAVGGNTLVIELLAKNLQELNKFRSDYTLSSLLRNLQKKGLLEITKSREVKTNYHAKNIMRKEKPEDIISAMYDLSQLEEREIELLSAFSILPAENIEFEMMKTLLGASENLEKNLDSLSQKGWIEFNDTEKSFKCSPVIQEITKKKNPKLFEHCKILIDTLKEKLDYQPGTGHFLNATYKEAAIFSRYSESIVSAFLKTENIIAILCERIGNFHKTTGNFEKALEFYGKGYHIDKKLCECYPENVKFKSNLAISCQFLGYTYSELGNLEKALLFYIEFNQLEKDLNEAFPNNKKYINGLAISCSKLGGLYNSKGNLKKALKYFEENNRLEKDLNESFPDNVEFKSNLACSYQFLGIVHCALNNIIKTLEFYEEHNRLIKELSKANPDNVEIKDCLAVSYQNSGYKYSVLNDREKALKFYVKFNSLEKELHKALPLKVEYKQALAISCSKLGDAYSTMGNHEKALEYYEEFNRLEKELYESFPDNVEFKNNLAISCFFLGAAYEKDGDNIKAKKYFELSKELFTDLVNKSPQYIEFKKKLTWVENKLSEL